MSTAETFSYDGSPEKDVVACKTCGDLYRWDEPEEYLQLDFLVESADDGCVRCRAWVTGIRDFLQTNRIDPTGLKVVLREGDELLMFLRRRNPSGYPTVLNLRVYTCPDDATEGSLFCIRKTIPPLIMDPATLNRISTWIDDCLNNDEHCKVTSLGNLPARLLECSTLESSNSIFVKLIDVVPGGAYDYLALSYCWGQAVPTVTTMDNISIHKTAIHDVPALFTGVFDLVLRLGYRYIWIDALCIVQDDLRDWESESSKMASIYEGAIATLSIARGHDTSTSLYEPKDLEQWTDHRTSDTLDGYKAVNFTYLDRNNGEQKACISQTVSHSHIYDRELDGNLLNDFISSNRHDFDNTLGWIPEVSTCREIISKSTGESAIFNRGWTFQERLISPRVIQILPSEIGWECRSSHDCECGDSVQYYQSITRTGSSYRNHISLLGGRDLEFGNSVYAREDIVSKSKVDCTRQWYRLVSAYFKRSLTYSDDVFPALSGVAHLIKQPALGSYGAGIWEGLMPISLLWSTLGAPVKRCVPWRAPTWSWASLTWIGYSGDLDTHWGRERVFVGVSDYYIEAHVDELTCVSHGLDAFGRLSSASVVITGPVLRVRTESSIDSIHNESDFSITFDQRRGSRTELEFGCALHPGSCIPNHNTEIRLKTTLPAGEDKWFNEEEASLILLLICSEFTRPRTKELTTLEQKSAFDPTRRSHRSYALCLKQSASSAEYERCGVCKIEHFLKYRHLARKETLKII